VAAKCIRRRVVHKRVQTRAEHCEGDVKKRPGQ
jgi:hypothetical protein